MPDKGWNKLNALDRAIRVATNVGMESGTVLTIEFVSGFELFNTRAYHNDETWSQGYRVTGRGVTVEREDLDDAIETWIAARAKLESTQSVVAVDPHVLSNTGTPNQRDTGTS